MKTYLVFEPTGGSRNAETADQVIFLREKFSWMALLFAPLWLLWHRLWLSFVGWLVAVTLIAGIAYLLDLDPMVTAITLELPSLVVAFEGTELRRRKLLWDGYRDAGVAVGDDLEDAERRFFENWAAQREVRPENALTMPVLATPGRSVIGLFPEPGGGR